MNNEWISFCVAVQRMSDKNKTEIYKTIREWKKIDKMVKQAEMQFMNLQLAEDVEKMINEHNDRGLGDEAIQDKTQNQKDL